jgi:transcriptional regulator with XRE-family HTH domain
MKPKPPLASVTANALRRAQGLSEEEVAQRSGISERMVGHYMTGEREPKGEVMDKLVSAMGYDPGSDQAVRRALERVCGPGEEPRSQVWRFGRLGARERRLEGNVERLFEAVDWLFETAEGLFETAEGLFETAEGLEVPSRGV